MPGAGVTSRVNGIGACSMNSRASAAAAAASNPTHQLLLQMAGWWPDEPHHCINASTTVTAAGQVLLLLTTTGHSRLVCCLASNGIRCRMGLLCWCPAKLTPLDISSGALLVTWPLTPPDQLYRMNWLWWSRYMQDIGRIISKKHYLEVTGVWTSRRLSL